MTPFYADDWLTVYGGDCREVMAALPADSVDCVVSSPPYWGLRDYGTATWVGGDAECDHTAIRRPGPQDKSASNRGSSRDPVRHDCRLCGAIRQDSQLGLERTPEEYVANMVNVFREVRRVLKPSGTCWLNLGDSYAANWNSRRPEGGGGLKADKGRERITRPPDGLKSKDLVGIPWRVAFALQADGWYLRSDVIWSKPNPMPESVTDRPTKSHEYLFLLTKSARYYFDADAVREKAVDGERFHGGYERPSPTESQARTSRRNGRADAKTYSAAAYGDNPHSEARGPKANFGVVTHRNIRSVWTIATRPYPGAHFAVFPPELPERCIKAGSPEHGLILDPFAGSGTVGMVANRLSRRAILIDLNPEYLKQQMTRNAQTPLGLGAA
jgi:DNA modification methylase